MFAVYDVYSVHFKSNKKQIFFCCSFPQAFWSCLVGFTTIILLALSTYHAKLHQSNVCDKISKQ